MMMLVVMMMIPYCDCVILLSLDLFFASSNLFFLITLYPNILSFSLSALAQLNHRNSNNEVQPVQLFD